MKNYNEIKLELDFLTNSNIRTNSINVPKWEFKKERDNEQVIEIEDYLFLENVNT